MSTKTIFEPLLSDPFSEEFFISKEKAANIFQFFQQNPLFRWQDANNDCEDRANAICILLDEWYIPNYKAWVFSGAYLKGEIGSLVNLWNYHVAAALPVQENNGISIYVIDPATLNHIDTIENWANGVTDIAYSYHLVKYGWYYIFPPGTISNNNWFTKNKQNYKWTIQGLAGINGVSRTGKAQLVFNKPRIRKTEGAFNKLLRSRPVF